jgi:uncharacterized protein
MKFILLAFVIVLGVWLWRSSRPTLPRQRPPPAETQTKPLDMVSCAFCAVHLPAADAIQGKKGVYCSADHLARAEH